MGGRIHWWYHGADGRRVFQHYRYPRTPTPEDPRVKGYGYRYPKLVENGVVIEWDHRKHPMADTLIYRLPWVLAHPDEVLLSVEGERDADAATRLGVLATSHHGGAGHLTEAMAQSLAAHRGWIILVADADPAGAYDVCRRYDLLRAVGIPAKRLGVREVVPRHPGADLRDHLAAGYRLRDLRRANLGRLREVAATVTGSPGEGSWAVTPKEIDELRTWRSRVEAVPRNATTPATRPGPS